MLLIGNLPQNQQTSVGKTTNPDPTSGEAKRLKRPKMYKMYKIDKNSNREDEFETENSIFKITCSYSRNIKLHRRYLVQTILAAIGIDR